MSKTKVTSPLSIGHKVFIRTVTNYFTGEIVGLSASEVLLAQCAWIGDTSRFATALATGQFLEVEPYPAKVVVSVNRASIVDVSEWGHPLPLVQK